MRESKELDFRGIKLNAARGKLPQGYFQVDENGDRFHEGTWRVRKGMRKMNTDKQSSPVLTIVGVELFGEGFGLATVAGGQVDGYTDVSQVTGAFSTGFGVGGFGMGGFGA